MVWYESLNITTFRIIILIFLITFEIPLIELGNQTAVKEIITARSLKILEAYFLSSDGPRTIHDVKEWARRRGHRHPHTTNVQPKKDPVSLTV